MTTEDGWHPEQKKSAQIASHAIEEFTKRKKEIMNITIFGGAQPRPSDEVYQQGILLGQLLAESGHTVLTGGYMGIMEAVFARCRIKRGSRDRRNL